MVIAPDQCPAADVVFVIEKTANLGAYLDQSDGLRDNYILPTLKYFNGGTSDDRDYGFEENAAKYALVAFMAADCDPEPAVTCYGQTTKISRVVKWLDQISFVGGAGEGNSHVAEGLSTAMQVFDDFQAQREPSFVAQKHCILICNSSPYSLPSAESLNYSGYTADQLAILMKSRGINLTLFSPRKIPALLKLYGHAGGNLQLMLTENYAKDRRHLILLKGFHLEKSPLSPPKLEPKPKQIQPETIPNISSDNSLSKAKKRPASDSPLGSPPPYKQHVRGPATNPPPTTFVPNTTSQEIPKPVLSNPNQNQLITPNIVTRASASLPEVVWSNVKQNQMHVQTTQSQDLNRFPMVPRPVNQLNTSVSSNVVSSSGQIINRPVGMMYGSQVTINSTQQAPNQGFDSRISQDTNNSTDGACGNGFQSVNPTSGQYSTRNVPSHLQNFIQNERRCIWAGMLEWQDRLKPGIDPNFRITRELPCRILSCVTQSGEIEVNAQYWPGKLSMPLVPKQFLSTFAGQYLKNPKKIIFNFQSNDDGICVLHNALSTGFAGCVQLTNALSETRLIIVLNTPDKREYVGFIANDQNGLITAFKNACALFKNRDVVPRNQNVQRQIISAQQYQSMPSSSAASATATATTMAAGNQQQYATANVSHVTSVSPGAISRSPMPTSVGQQQSHSGEIEVDRVKNLMTIQQLQQNLEAAQQRELQFEAVQQQQRQMRLQLQLQQQIQQQQQNVQQYRMSQGQEGMSSANPHLRQLLQTPQLQQLYHVSSQQSEMHFPDQSTNNTMQ